MMKIATLIVPSGWTIMDDVQLQEFIQNEVSSDSNRNILAVAMPDNRIDDNVFAQLEYLSIGHIENPAIDRINLPYLIQKMEEDIEIINSENNLDSSSRIRWKGFMPAPTFDRKTQSLIYGIALYFGKDIALNLHHIWLVREGAIVLTLVGRPQDRLSLKGWDIKIEAEMQYARFRPGRDHRAQGNLENLILMNRFI